MAWTYDVDALDEELHRLRFEIGDTISTRPLLTDEEIMQIASEESVFSIQAAKCCRLICAQLAGSPDRFRIEEFTEERKGIYSRYLEMARKFEAQAGGAPWAGSIEKSFKEATETDDSLVTPIFKRDQFSNL